jgi:hypothetical protein
MDILDQEQEEAEVFETGSIGEANEDDNQSDTSSIRSDINTSPLDPPDSRKFISPLDTRGQDYSDSLRRRRTKFTNFPDRQEYAPPRLNLDILLMRKKHLKHTCRNYRG